MGTFPKPTAADSAWFQSLFEGHPEVTLKPMFGNLAAFVNGQMAVGLLGSQVAVRLDEMERGELLREPGAHPFAPMPGKPMREYVVLPAAYRSDPARTRLWVARACAWAATKPPKLGQASKSGMPGEPPKPTAAKAGRGRTTAAKPTAAKAGPAKARVTKGTRGKARGR